MSFWCWISCNDFRFQWPDDIGSDPFSRSSKKSNASSERCEIHHHHHAFWGFVWAQTFKLFIYCEMMLHNLPIKLIFKLYEDFIPSHPVKTLLLHIKSLRERFKCANSDGNVSHFCNILKDPLLCQWFELVRTFMLMHKSQISVTWKPLKAFQAELNVGVLVSNAFFMRGFYRETTEN